MTVLLCSCSIYRGTPRDSHPTIFPSQGVAFSRVAIQLEKGEMREKSGKNVFDEKVRGIHENLSKSGKNEIVLANDLENVDVAQFVSIFCQRIRVISVTYCYTSDKLESGKKNLSQEKK